MAEPPGSPEGSPHYPSVPASVGRAWPSAGGAPVPGWGGPAASVLISEHLTQVPAPGSRAPAYDSISRGLEGPCKKKASRANSCLGRKTPV